MLLHYKISIHMNVTLTLHAKLPLSRDCYCKRMLPNAFFLFHIYHGKIQVSL